MLDLMSHVILGVIGASLRRTRLVGVRISRISLASQAASRTLAGDVATLAHMMTHSIPQRAYITRVAAPHSERPLGVYLRRPWPSPWRLRGNPPSDPSSPVLWMDSFRTLPAPVATEAILT